MNKVEEFLERLKNWEGTPFAISGQMPREGVATTCTGFIGWELARVWNSEYYHPKVIGDWRPAFISLFSQALDYMGIPHVVLEPPPKPFEKGDILFIRPFNAPNPYHVAVYLGSGKIIHARRDRVVIEPIKHLSRVIKAVIRIRWGEVKPQAEGLEEAL